MVSLPPRNSVCVRFVSVMKYSQPLPSGLKVPPRLAMTVNAPVRFALEKDKLYVVGEDGKEYELKLTKKILKTDQ